MEEPDYEAMVHHLAATIRGDKPYTPNEVQDVRMALQRGVYKRQVNRYLNMPWAICKQIIKDYGL